MATAPLFTVLEMIWLVVRNTMETTFSLLVLFSRLIGELGFVSDVGGSGGFLLSLIIIAAVGFGISKFVFGAEKTVVLLVIVGLIILWIIVLASLV
jgi:hypothetical protein